MLLLDVATKILAVFKKHHIKGIYGLLNGRKIEESKDGLTVLQEWLKADNYWVIIHSAILILLKQIEMNISMISIRMNPYCLFRSKGPRVPVCKGPLILETLGQ